jgi:hypothetical protein
VAASPDFGPQTKPEVTMTKLHGWSRFDTDEKLEALKADVHRALGRIDKLDSWKESADYSIKRVADEIVKLKK